MSLPCGHSAMKWRPDFIRITAASAPSLASGTDTLRGGAGDDILRGGDDADFLYGGSSADRLDGGSGADWLNGGTGNDTMTGGTGEDAFVFAQITEGEADRISDFEDGTDVIVLNGLVGVSFASLTLTDVTGGVEMQLADGHMVLIEGVSTDMLTQDDFLFL